MHSKGYLTRESHLNALLSVAPMHLISTSSTLFPSMDSRISVTESEKMCQSNRTYHLLQQNNNYSNYNNDIIDLQLKLNSQLFNNNDFYVQAVIE